MSFYFPINSIFLLPNETHNVHFLLSLLQPFYFLMPNYIYGIDFGTSNSALAILDQDTNEIVKLFTVPSLLFFYENQKEFKGAPIAIGEDAITNYVANRMHGRFMKSIKKILPNKNFVDTRIGAKRYSAEDLVSLILQNLIDKADDFLGEKITKAVIGRPVIFDEDPVRDAIAEERLAKAARIAGLEEFYFQMEPIGAAFTYQREIESPKLVLVADFGGGTSDFSLMKLIPENMLAESKADNMLAQGGIYIGGDSFDSDIMWNKGTPHFGRGVKEEFIPGKKIDLPLNYFLNICSWERMNFLDTLRMRLSIQKSYQFSKQDYRVKNLQILIEKNLGYAFFKQIEKAKIELGTEDMVFLSFNQHDIIINEPIEAIEFSGEIINENLGKITNYLDLFLEKHSVAAENVDVVFMTGGTSQVRPLKEHFINKFGLEKITSGDNFNSVAMGLAYSFGFLSKNQ